MFKIKLYLLVIVIKLKELVNSPVVGLNKEQSDMFSLAAQRKTDIDLIAVINWFESLRMVIYPSAFVT